MLFLLLKTFLQINDLQMHFVGYAVQYYYVLLSFLHLFWVSIQTNSSLNAVLRYMHQSSVIVSQDIFINIHLSLLWVLDIQLKCVPHIISAFEAVGLIISYHGQWQLLSAVHSFDIVAQRDVTPEEASGVTEEKLKSPICLCKWKNANR